MNGLPSSPLLQWLLSYLFNALWQTPLIFAAAWITVRMLRRAHPQIEHRVWVSALLLEIVLPACHLPVGGLHVPGVRMADLRMSDLWLMLCSWLPGAQGTAIHSGQTRVIFGPAFAGGNALHLPAALLTGIALAYACSVLYFAGRLAWGLFQTHTLARTATRLRLRDDVAEQWRRCCHRFGIRALLPEIATSPRTIGPVTVGLRRGLLLLPPGFLDNLTPQDRDAVFTHELAHMARHDFAKNLLYGLASLPVAWHPLVWCTRARIAESRELVCDTIAAEAGPGRKQYAQSLLRLAAMLSGHPPVAGLHAIGILSLNPDANTLERRIMTLTHKRTPMSAARRTMVAAACSAIILATCGSALALRTDVAALDGTAGSPTRIHVKGAVMAGQKIAGENPTYPKQAREKKIQGTVLLELTIGKDGAPQDLHVTESPDKELADSAMKAVRTWRWRPYLLKGDPVEVETTVRVTYNLGG